MNKVYIIIVTYNSMQWLSKCLESTKNYDVIVVDNNSSDETINFIQINYPEVTVIQQTNNLGFGAANNIGISYALKNNADYIFLLNQDAYLQSTTIDKLVEVHKKNTDFGIISPIHLNGDGTKLDANFSSYINLNKEIQYDALKLCFAKTVYDLPFVNAAGWLLPRKTLEIIGGFDPIFFHYGEDDNYCQRVLFHGFKIGVMPTSFIFHDRGNRGFKMPSTLNEKLQIEERKLKRTFGNINIDFNNQNFSYTPKLCKLLIKSCLKLKFKSVIYYFKVYMLFKSLREPIFKSRKLNKLKGKHYLNEG